MRALRGVVVAGVGLVLPVLFACASPPEDEAPPVVTAAFSEGTAMAAQARDSGGPKARTDLEECRRARQQGVSPRERGFPCEAFLGE